MESPAYAIGQAVFIKTDFTVDYAEETVPFRNLEEMVRICTEPRPNRTLEKVVVYSMVHNEAVALTLGFVASSRGQRPKNLQFADE